LRLVPSARQTLKSIASVTDRIEQSPIITCTFPACRLRAPLVDPDGIVAGVHGVYGVAAHSAFSQ
jgi:hypothetical protein